MDKLNKEDILKYINITDKLTDESLYHLLKINKILEKDQNKNNNFYFYILFTIILVIIIIILLYKKI